MKHRDRDPGIVAQTAYPPIAGVEQATCPGTGCERHVGAIVVTDAAPQCPVAGRGAELFDPRVLIGRDHLVGQLPPDPMGLLREDDPAPEPGSRQRRCTRAKPSSDDSDVGAQYLHVVSLAGQAMPGMSGFGGGGR